MKKEKPCRLEAIRISTVAYSMAIPSKKKNMDYLIVT
jgi:hypothetical protein